MSDRVDKTWVYDEWEQIVFHEPLLSLEEQGPLLEALFAKCFVKGTWASDVTIYEAGMVTFTLVSRLGFLTRFEDAIRACDALRMHEHFGEIDDAHWAECTCLEGVCWWQLGERDKALEVWERCFATTGDRWKCCCWSLCRSLLIILDEPGQDNKLDETLHSIAVRLYDRWDQRKQKLQLVSAATTNSALIEVMRIQD